MIYVLDINGKIKATLTGGGGGDATASNQTSGAQKTQLVDAGGEVATITGGKLDVNASVDTTGLATSTIQTDGTQKSQIVDAGGDAVTVTGGKLDVNASVDTTGLSTEAKQDTGNTSLATIAGKDFATQTTLAALNTKVTAVNTGAVVVSSSALPTGAANQTKQDTGNTSLASIDGKITAVNTGAVVVASSALPSGASTGAKQDTGNTSLASIDSKLTNPLPVSGTVAVSSLPSGLATSANQTTEIAGLSSIDTRLISQATAAKQDAQTALLTTIDGDTSNLDVALSTRTKPSDQQHTIVDYGTLTAVTAITNPLPAGTNAIGKLAANSGVDIGDVDVTSVSGNVTVVQATGTNLHSVIDSGTITTVSTVTSVTAIANALPAGNNNIGDVDIASIAAGNNNIGDVDVASIAAGTNIIGKVGIDQTTPGTTNKVSIGTDGTVAINTALPAGTNLLGKVSIDQTTPGTTNMVSNSDGSGNALVSQTTAITGSLRGLVTRNITPVLVSTSNSTTIILTASSIYTGTFEDSLGYGIIYVAVKSDVASATSGFVIEFSDDGATNRGSTDSYTIAANTLKEFAFNPALRYYRVKYTNGTSDQASFLVQTILKETGLPSSHRINETLTDETDAQMVKAALTGRASSGTWVSSAATAAYSQPLISDAGLVVTLSPNTGTLSNNYRQNEEMLVMQRLELNATILANERYGGGNYGFEFR